MKNKYEPKHQFKEKIESILKNKEDIEKYWEISRKGIQRSIRCNTLKISIEELKKRLESKGWKIKHPFKDNPEIMVIESNLQPGELGRTIEHLLGYYYVQEIASMMPIIALNPKPEEIILDIAASPGSKTTQAAAMMENKGTIIANDVKLGRISILNTNLERCGVSNTIITRHDGVQLYKRLEKINMKFDKILCDVPCSGEGTLRSSPKTFLMWNEKVVKVLSKMQKKLAESALELLKVGGEMIYSTCTHSPEENESVLNHLKEKFNIEIEKINLPIKCRPGLAEWKDQSFDSEIKNACRIWPQDNNTEGFFVAKIRRLG